MKKHLVLLAAAVLGMGILAGCGGADENKSPEAIKAEVAKMDRAAIEGKIKEYEAAIVKKTAELDKVKAEIAKIPFLEQTGDKAKKLQAQLTELAGSISKLGNAKAAYASGLAGK